MGNSGIDALRYGNLRFRLEDAQYGSVFTMYDVQRDPNSSALFLAVSPHENKITLNGNLQVSGTKNRVVDTGDSGRRVLYCYETASPMFGDIGCGKTDTGGDCYIYLDSIIYEAVNAKVEYQVFLQKEGSGDLFVEEKTPQYFHVRGTPGLKFAWELKARQKGYEYERMELEKGYETEGRGIDAASALEWEYEKEIDKIIKEKEEMLL